MAMADETARFVLTGDSNAFCGRFVVAITDHRHKFATA
jgi:hypothetical protein